MKRIGWIMILIFSVVSLPAKNYFIAVYGNDTNNGSIESPFASLNKAQSLVEANHGFRGCICLCIRFAEERELFGEKNLLFRL